MYLPVLWHDAGQWAIFLLYVSNQRMILDFIKFIRQRFSNVIAVGINKYVSLEEM